ncbi:hypothetical protein ABDJ41_19855 [Pedobacter sp. ASV1-7]|uniref:Crp/Fnr family transcriptional regulator n=1 Tax=Pedobacter sp. ASV1-7 TaxID=3145237 RepID=UPI0032E8C4A3
MAWFEEIDTPRKDFESLMGCLFVDRRLPDLGFEGVFFGMLKTLVYHRPMILQYERKAADRAFFVVRGFVFAFFYNQDQEIVPFRIFRQGELALIPEGIRENVPADYALMVCADTRLLEVSFEQMKELYQAFPWCLMAVLRVMATGFFRDFDKSLMISLGHKESIRRFYELYGELFGNVSFRFRDMYIARFLNMNPVTFSKLRRELFPAYPLR